MWADKRFRRTTLVFAVGAIPLIAASLFYWRGSSLEGWIKKEMIASYLKKVQPHLPFVIENIEVKESRTGILSGNLAELSLTVRWNPWRIRFSGPIEIKKSRKTGETYFEYLAQTTIEPVFTLKSLGEKSSPLQVRLKIRAAKNMTELGELALRIQSMPGTDQFKWPLMGVQAKAPNLHLHWLNGLTTIRFEAQSAQWEQSDQKAIDLTSLSFESRIPLSLSPIGAGPEATFGFSVKEAELLWNNFYLDLPLAKLPLSGTWNFPSASLGLEIGTFLHLKGTLPTQQLQWKTAKIPIQNLLVGPLSHLPLKIKEGFLRTEGEVSFSSGFPRGKLALSVRKLSFAWLKNSLAVKDLDFDLPFSTLGGTHGWVSEKKILFRHARASLGHTKISILPEKKPMPKKFSVQLGDDENPLPFFAKGIPLSIGSIYGIVSPFEKPAKIFDLKTSLHLDALDIHQLADPVCIKNDRLPPAALSLDFPGVEVTPDSIDIDGQARIGLFGGTIEIEKMGLFDLGSEVPETDFNLDASGIQLEALGDWLGFGKMKGTLNAYAHDVTIESWLPTSYHARFEVQPLDHWRVIFSSEAMKNFVRLFAGDDVDNLPGIANWVAFGWPSRVLGGYDIIYSGIDVFSKDGTIVVRTPDPDPPLEPGHFILYGPFFRILLNSPHYPLVMDATAMGNFTRHLINQLAQMRKSKQGSPKSDEEEGNSDEEETNTCVPSDF